MQFSDLAACELRSKARRNTIDYGDLSSIAETFGSTPGEVLGIARDIGMEVKGIPERRPGPGSRPREATDHDGKPESWRVTDLVKKQIVQARIFRAVMPADGSLKDDSDFVVTTRGRLMRERKAIMSWIAELTKDLSVARADLSAARKEISDLRASIARSQLDESVEIDAGNVEERDPETFFSLPR